MARVVNEGWMNYNFVIVKKTPSTTPLDPSKLAVKPALQESSADQTQYLMLVVDHSLDNLTMISLDLF